MRRLAELCRSSGVSLYINSTLLARVGRILQHRLKKKGNFEL